MEGEQEVQKLIRIGEIGVKDLFNLLEAVEQRAPVDVECLGGARNILMMLQEAPRGLVELRVRILVLIPECEELFVADHVGGKLPRGLLQNVGQRDLVELVNPDGRIAAFADGERYGSLYILAVEVKMSQDFAAVPGGKETVPDKDCELLGDLIPGKRGKAEIDEDNGIPLMLDAAGGRNRILDVAADGAQRQVFDVRKPDVDQDALVIVGGQPADGGELLADVNVIGFGVGQERLKRVPQGRGGIVALYGVG